MRIAVGQWSRWSPDGYRTRDLRYGTVTAAEREDRHGYQIITNQAASRHFAYSHEAQSWFTEYAKAVPSK